MDLRHSIRQLLTEIGPGRMMSTAYDTAWIARLDGPMGVRAVEWLREHQLTDGSWGANEPRYYHDRVICTLAAMIALAEQEHAQDVLRLQRAQFALEVAMRGLGADPTGATVGFEMIVPTLLDEALSLGIFRGWQHPMRRENDLPVRLARQRAAKLEALPSGIVNRFVTAAFSSEMAGSDGLRLLNAETLQEANGSVGHSPSATAYFVSYVRPNDPAAMAYLHQFAVNGDEGVPDVAPFDVFERAWTLWNLALTGSLDDELQDLCQPHLDFLETAWQTGKGIGFAAGYTPNDGDDTGLVYEVLTHFGRSVDLEAVLHYEKDDHFRCYELEANPSISANIHILGALRQAGLGVQHPTVQKAVQFLRRARTLQFWLDKWHASPYYPTAHAIIACAGYENELVKDTVLWILGTQNGDGSWGYYMPSAEETAYCLQALIVWQQRGGRVPGDALKRGVTWLAEHAEPPYPPLWVGKCLYCPILVVRSAVLSALAMAEQG